MKRPPQDSAARLQWLADRAEISDLLLAFVRAIDDKDQDAYADAFAENGHVQLPHATAEGREAIRTMRRPPAHWSTHHVLTNHQIEIDGDTASARAYLEATHVFDATKPAGHARAGGWYDTTLVRTGDGWRFKSVALTIIWNTGEMIRPQPPVPAN